MNRVFQESMQCILDDIKHFQLIYKNSLKSNVGLINTVINYISKKKGKQLRPALCILSARLSGVPNENTFKAASLLEMIHVATLMHDDVVDESMIRRGWPSVNRIWKNKISILVGDYMFSKALGNMIEIKNFDALNILSKTAERLSQGEILQIEKVIKKEMDEEIYYEMVSDKTASLFSAACELGSITVSEDKEKSQALYKFGEKFGLVFQIQDDLLDIIGNVDALGKPTIFDLKKNMQTLPLIYIFKKLSKSKLNKLKRKLKFHLKRSEIHSIKKIILEEGGVDYAKNQIKHFSDEALNELDIFPDSEYKEALCSLLKFNIERIN
ncbi:MAG: polyprenyl synthetase family protein [Candidatus Neomarinimicrobiota bacterium]|nr:polyprenyl synthetase family protein [Candidatus Neomarinimicrobiota bacterium]|tara:strand:- start:356 stop:1333 length:978 start_codon:yes stop_codon:yes gene_type:complete